MRKLKRAETFLPRREIVKTINVPIQSQECIIIKPNEEGLGYRLDCYNESILGGKIDRKRFNDTVFKCCKICQTVWSQKKLIEEKDPMIYTKYEIIASLAILMAGFLCFVISSYGNLNMIDRDDVAVAGLILITLHALLVVILVTIQIKRKDVVRVNLEEECQNKLQQFLDSENKIYNVKGLNWQFGEHFFWLELHVVQ